MGATVQPLPGVVLIIEDDSGAAELITSVVREQGWETAHAATGAAALAWLADHTPALVLLDYALPDMTGVQFLERVGRPLPFMVTTGAGDERTAVALMKHGARDYLIKDTRFLDTLSLALCRILKQIETERQLARTEAALQESEERFRRLLQDVQGVAVQGYGPDGTTQYWNHASEQLYGYSAAEAIGRNLVDLIVPPAVRGHVEQAIREMAESGLPIPAAEVSLRRKDGSLVAVFSSHTIVQVPGKPQELFCLDIDLTERKRAEAEQARQLDELRRWQVVTLGREGRIAELKREVNGLAARLGMPLPYSTPECSEGKGKG
jgi:PAS domain S-box-containing protein